MNKMSLTKNIVRTDYNHFRWGRFSDEVANSLTHRFRWSWTLFVDLWLQYVQTIKTLLYSCYNSFDHTVMIAMFCRIYMPPYNYKIFTSADVSEKISISGAKLCLHQGGNNPHCSNILIYISMIIDYNPMYTDMSARDSQPHIVPL